MQASAATAQEAEQYRLRLEAELGTVKSRLEAANQKYRDVTEQVAAQKALRATVQNRLDEANQKYRAATEQVVAQKAELAAVHNRLDAANQKYRDVSEQVTVLKERATQEEATRKVAEQALQEATTQLKETQSSLQKELGALQQQLAQSIAEGQSKMAAMHEAEIKLTRFEAERAMVQSRLDEANHKYRAATEQVAAQKAELDAARSRLERHRLEGACDAGRGCP